MKQLLGTIVLAAFVACSSTIDRKSTRLNSSHMSISYAVFCLNKKTLLLTRVPLDGIFSVVAVPLRRRPISLHCRLTGPHTSLDRRSTRQQVAMQHRVSRHSSL